MDRAGAKREQMAIADGLDRLVLWARRGAPVQMSSTSITTLDTLAYAGPLRITGLADREGVSQPGMTALVNRLVGDGYAERLADRTDGRATLVRITPGGRAVLGERRQARSAALQAVIARLPIEHQAALGAAVAALHAMTLTTLEYEKSGA
ncbi:MAG TPA: MarR family transcriptional regulator [Mycobacteriales bacterium]|nr:MarR family transcriptional regulator [Mycobacteriales bacterium]